MIRFALCSALCALTLVLALATAAVQSKNRERGIALDALREECDMIEAINGERCERILALDWEPLRSEPALAPTSPSVQPLAQGRLVQGRLSP